MSAESNSPEERRIFERFSARFPVKFKDTREDYGTDVFLRDASAGGVRILSKQHFYLDDLLSLEVELPGGTEPMVLNGRVKWQKLLDSSLWEMGVQFSEVHFFKTQRLFKLAESTASSN
ncbi:MAG: PilZ domain-containing protein [Candidatus Omnitrophica bacterium]|nr:PilZ domain-containing protein [Candidatus Omnitrophota bacterium]